MITNEEFDDLYKIHNFLFFMSPSNTGKINTKTPYNILLIELVYEKKS